MSPESISLFFSLTIGAIAPLGQAPTIVKATMTAPATFLPAERAVRNWRWQAARKLALDPESLATLIGGRDPKGLGRCVKLNNYWCIKGVGWNGMVAADAEGHVAFASAADGATVAALLLRRYYLEFSRRSASAIVSRWAPAQCGAPVASIARSGNAASIAQRRRNLGPEPKARPVAMLATHGVGATLRARYLSAKRGGSRTLIRRSVVPDRVQALIHAPTIAAGFGESKVALPALSLARLLGPIPTGAGAFGGGAIPAFPSCTLDGQRLRNYAQRAIDGIASSPDTDLDLFEPDGTPKASLARLMENMANVEIGPLKANPALIQEGIARATAALRAARASAASADASPTASYELRR